VPCVRPTLPCDFPAFTKGRSRSRRLLSNNDFGVLKLHSTVKLLKIFIDINHSEYAFSTGLDPNLVVLLASHMFHTTPETIGDESLPYPSLSRQGSNIRYVDKNYRVKLTTGVGTVDLYKALVTNLHP